MAAASFVVHILPLALALAGVPEETPAPQHDVVSYRLDVEASGRTVRGWVEVELTVGGTTPVEDLVFVLYPNRYRSELSGVNDINFVRVYPKSASSGGMTVKTDTGQLEMLDQPGFEPGTVARLRLPEPVAVGETARVVLTFETDVPEKFGSFGYWRDFLLLNGGWYPMLAPRDADGHWTPEDPPERARFQVRLHVPAKSWAIVDQQVIEPGPAQGDIRDLTVENVRYLLLGVAGELHRHTHGDLAILQPDGAKRLADRELKLWGEAETWLGTFQGAPPPPVTALESYLPRELMFPNAALPLLSYRLYRITPPLRKYHDLHVARAYFAGAIRDHVRAMEHASDDDPWIEEGLSWELAESFILSRGKIKDPRAYMRNLAWIPAVDLVLYSARFPFAAEYYGNFYWTDPLRDDPTLYGNRRPNGHVALEKLRDRFGNETVQQIIAQYMSAKPEEGGFRQIAEKITGEDLSEFFELWRGPLPYVNYAITDLDSRRKAGRYVAQLELQRTGPKLDEPVKIRLTTRKGKKEIVWTPNGEKEEELEVELKAPVKKVQLDPGNRLLETVRWDNRYPRAWKFVLQYFYVDIDYKIGEAAGAAGIELQRTWDKRNEIDSAVFWTQESLGAEVGYVRSFGPETWYRSLLHRVGIFLLVERLDTGFAKDGLHVIPGFDPLKSEVDGSVGAVLAYRYDNRLDFRWPRSGSRFSIALEGGLGIPNRTGPYFRWNTRFVHLHRITDRNVFALQAKAGSFIFTSPRGLPLPKLFFIGGIDDVRGLSEPEIVGPTRALLSAEWRWFAVRNLDWNLWFARIRGFQPVFFADTGYISNGALTVPAFDNWIKDAGFALRVHWDALGVRPMLLRLDFAQRIDPWFHGDVSPDVRFYMGLGQSF